MRASGHYLLAICLLATGLTHHALAQGRTHTQPAIPATPREIILDVQHYRDRLAGSVYGQLFGLAWGFHGGIEFRYRRKLVPVDALADWADLDVSSAMRAPAGDDFYCELSGILALQAHGATLTYGQIEPFYRNTSYALWHADALMRDNLRRHVRAPRCGHYKFQLANAVCGHADDLDAQMQVDFCGTSNPGNPHAAIAQAWKFAHMMAYGDGAIGAAVMAAMNAQAFVAKSTREIVEVGVMAAPTGSSYRRVLDDVIAWHAQWPDDWTKTWAALDQRWGDDDRCPQGRGKPFNIDAKLHGAFVLMGLLYGKGDFGKSLRLTIRCGQDTDTSAQNLGSILGAYLGAARLPKLIREQAVAASPQVIEGSQHTLADLLAMLEHIAADNLMLAGGTPRVRHLAQQWIVRRREPLPVILEQWPATRSVAPRLQARIARTQGRRITFAADATRGDGQLNYQWHFGDLSYGNGAAITHEYLLPGSYEAVCYVADRTGRTSYQLVEVTVAQ